MRKILVIGGGIAGLTAALAHKLRGNDVTLLEASSRVGGKIQTIRENGFLAESGPSSFMVEDKILYDFLRETGILDAAIEPKNSAKNRYILRERQPRLVPNSLATAVTTKLFSVPAKIRLLGDILMPRHKNQPTSVADFVRHRIGREMYDYALNPLVSGIFAGDPEKLDVRFAFPKVWNLDQKYGSLILGTFPNARAKKRSRQFEKKRTFSFPQGMETLPKLLAARLGNAIFLNAEIDELQFLGNGESAKNLGNGDNPVAGASLGNGDNLVAESSLGNGDNLVADSKNPSKSNLKTWLCRWHSRNSVCDFFQTSATFDELIIATPPAAFPQILKNLFPQNHPIFATAGTLYFPPVTTLTFGFAREQIAFPCDGFGMLVPAKENRKILGTLWTSSIFPNRAPDGFLTMTVYLGGAIHPEIAALPLDEKIAIAKRELAELLGVRGEPIFLKSFEHSQAIPQYNLGYENFLSALSAAESAFPNLHFIGNSRSGIAVGATLLSALKSVIF